LLGVAEGDTIAASGADASFLRSQHACSGSLRLKILAAALVLSVGMGLSAGCAELDQLSQEQIGTGLGALAGGVAGALVGTQFGSGTGQLIATLVGTVGGAWVGNRIGSYLDEQDRKRAAEAAQQATVTGQPQVWQNPDSGVSGKAEVVKTKTTQQKVAVPVLKDRVKEVPPLDLIGEPYRAKEGAASVEGLARITQPSDTLRRARR
jgi:surface antigen